MHDSHVSRFVEHDEQGELQSVQSVPCNNRPVAHAVHSVAEFSHSTHTPSQDAHTVPLRYCPAIHAVHLVVSISHVWQLGLHEMQTPREVAVQVVPGVQVGMSWQLLAAFRSLLPAHEVHLVVESSHSAQSE